MKVLKVTDTHYGFSHKTHKIHTKFLRKIANICRKESVEIILHAGDWIANNQHQLPRTWKMFREAFSGIPILTVMGNHDFWNQETFHTPRSRIKYARIKDLTNYSSIINQQREWAEEYNIHLLQDKSFKTKDVVFYGFDGWYNSFNPGTNDLKFMPKTVEGCPIHPYLTNLAHRKLDMIFKQAEKETRKKVLLTHIPPYMKEMKNLLPSLNANPIFMDFIAEYMDILCFGHTHIPEDRIIKRDGFRCRVINSGTNKKKEYGYDNPEYKIFEV